MSEARPTRGRKSAEERKTEIAEAALRLVDEVGPGRLTTEMVASAVGITQPAIFRHFPKKQDLWGAVANLIGDRAQRGWQSAEAEAADPRIQLERLVTAQLTLIESTPAIPAMLFSRELHGENPFLRSILTGVMNKFAKRLEMLVHAGQRADVIRGDVTAHDAALLLISQMQGLVMRWSLTGRGFDLPAEGRRLLEVQLLCLASPPKDTES